MAPWGGSMTSETACLGQTRKQVRHSTQRSLITASLFSMVHGFHRAVPGAESAAVAFGVIYNHPHYLLKQPTA